MSGFGLAVDSDLLEGLGRPAFHDFLFALEQELRHWLALKRKRERRAGDVLCFPPLNSYLRLLVHQAAERFGMRTLSAGTQARRCTLVTTIADSCAPVLQLRDLVPGAGFPAPGGKVPTSYYYPAAAARSAEAGPSVSAPIGPKPTEVAARVWARPASPSGPVAEAGTGTGTGVGAGAGAGEAAGQPTKRPRVRTRPGFGVYKAPARRRQGRQPAPQAGEGEAQAASAPASAPAGPEPWKQRLQLAGKLVDASRGSDAPAIPDGQEICPDCHAFNVPGRIAKLAAALPPRPGKGRPVKAPHHILELSGFEVAASKAGMAAVLGAVDGGYRVRWIDSTHCLLVFQSRVQAEQARGCDWRPIGETTTAAVVSDERLAEFGEHTRAAKPQRPQTSAVVANRLVGHALGIRIASTAAT